ncbi:ATP-binding protein [Xanthomonas sp. XNM01]|uniref:sensor histidine kinase n=1 Tax=Xanthomonas sp. XNM01 TaxID=2769289 RepID=UPI001CE202B3|nr:ATP-binding protein [Xanthomonas sp. XNM01]
MALQRFLAGYARLARLPPPQPAATALAPLCERVLPLLDAARIAVDIDPTLVVSADADQLEQVLINLVRNALEAGGDAPVRVEAVRAGAQVLIRVLDRGQGLPSSDSLFVPFFTTKPGGSGIGLVLSRQIVEAQQGTLELLPREDGAGSVAEIRLPAD